MPEPPNLLDLKPIRNFGWEAREDELVTVVVPKFRSAWLARWLVPLLRRPDFRVQLDAMGSFVWRQCDGATTVEEITEKVKRRSGGDATSVDERVAGFVQRLVRERLVSLDRGAGPP